jgi:hypothetical protein
MPTPPPNKQLLLIGASRGLGFALAEEYLERGWHVVATERSRTTSKLPTSRMSWTRRPEKRVFNIWITWVERFRGECEHAHRRRRGALHLSRSPRPDRSGHIGPERVACSGQQLGGRRLPQELARFP